MNQFIFDLVCVIAVEVVLVFFFFPETKGKTLEEVAFIFDGESAFGENHSRDVIVNNDKEADV